MSEDNEDREDLGNQVAVRVVAAEPTSDVVRLFKKIQQREAITGGQAKPDEDTLNWGGAACIIPLYDPDSLLNLYAYSDTLRQCIDAIAHNVDGHGWTAEPVIDLEAEDAAEHVANAIYLHRLSTYDPSDTTQSEPDLPSQDEVSAELDKLRAQARREKARMKIFFDSCCWEMPFAELRRRTTIDKESIGWGGWEVVRMNGRLVRFIHVSGRTLRLTHLEEESIEVSARIHTSPITTKPVNVKKRFRRIVQVTDLGKTGYFKEFGDPRVMSHMSGKFYESIEELSAAEPDSPPANEILWFSNYYPGTPYGNVRWHGQIPNVVGNRLVQELNCEYLGDSAIPRALLLVADGRMSSTSEKQLKEFFSTHKGHAHNRIAVIEATTPRENTVLEGSGKVKLEWVSLRDTQRDDATFSAYTERNSDKIGESMRIPPILRGKTKDFNRATAQAAIEAADEQVFAPDRQMFDALMNSSILPEIGVRFWRFRSRGPVKQDPDSVKGLLGLLLQHGVLVPAEARSLAEHLLGIDLSASAGDFQRIPLPMILQGHVPPQIKPATSTSENASFDADDATDQQDDQNEPERMAKAILKLRARLESALQARAVADALAFDESAEDVDQSQG